MGMKRYIGKLIYHFLGIHLPGSYSHFGVIGRKIRAFCGKMILDSCGTNVNIEKGAKFGSHISLGDNSGIGIRAEISDYVTIGNNVMMGPECIIYTRNHAFDNLEIPMCRQGFSEPKPVVIEDDVWIGGRVTILPGVHIATGSIIGAGSVVTKNVEPYTIVGGNPAHFLKKRGDKMKNILFVIPTMRMGGAEKSLVTLLNCMDRKKYKIDLLLFETGGVLQDDIPEDVSIIPADRITQAMILEFRLYAKNLLKDRHFIAYLHRLWTSVNPKIKSNEKFGWKYLRNYIPEFEKEYDIAISYLEGLTAFYLIDKVKAKKKIGWIHIDMTGRMMPEEEKQYYEKFDHLVTISDICRKVFLEHIPSMSGYISILENLTDAETVRKKAAAEADFSGWTNKALQIVTVGRLDIQKGIDLAVLACKKLHDEGVPVCWHVYGEGIQRNTLEKMIEENKLKGIFLLEGMKVNPYPYMAKADIIVQPSRYEGKSIVLDEAKVLGKAIVVTNYPSVEDQITDGETGLIVECEPEEIADGIKSLVNNKNVKNRLEKNNKRALEINTEVLNDFYRIVEM